MIYSYSYTGGTGRQQATDSRAAGQQEGQQAAGRAAGSIAFLCLARVNVDGGCVAAFARVNDRDVLR